MVGSTVYGISHQNINIKNCFVKTSVILTFFDQNSVLLQEGAHLSRNKAEHSLNITLPTNALIVCHFFQSLF